MLDSDIFCPRCGAPRKIKNVSELDDDMHKMAATTVDVTPEDEPEYIGQHNGSNDRQQYSMYYDSLEKTKKKKAGSCFLHFLLTVLIAVVIIAILFCGAMLLKGEDPIDYAQDLIGSIKLFEISTSDTDIVSVTDITSESDVIVTTTTTTTSTTFLTTMRTTATTTTTTTTKKTTTTTRATTTTRPVGQQVRDTSVGSWKADISSLGLSILGSKIKTINIDIDKDGNAKVNFKVGFVTVKTTGSFTVKDDGKTNLLIKVPYSDETVEVVGYSKVVSNNQIVFRCSEGDITLNRK